MALELFCSTNVITTVVVIALLYFTKRILSRPGNLPPGPTGYPIVGSMPLIVKNPMHIAFRKLRQQYGDIFSFRIGPKLTVVINGYENLREAFVKNAEDFSDRPDLFIFKNLLKEKGVVASSGQFWKDTRTFALNTLRGFGFGKRSLETLITEEVEAYLQVVDYQQGKPFDIKKTFQNCALNVICNLIFGRRFEHGDKTFVTIAENFDEFNRLNMLAGPLNFFPLLRYLPGNAFSRKEQDEVIRKILGFIDESIADHRKTVDENSPRDYIDAFLIEQKKNGNKEIMKDENLRYTVINIFGAGTQTTANTAYWAVFYLLHHNDIQNRLREEIENVVGSSRLPSLEDKHNMPYFEAFLTEIIRIANIVPTGVPHGLKRDVNFKGYTLPKGTVVFASLDSVLSDPEFFQNPTKFDPTRFLDKDGKVINTERIVGFSLGRRVCLGESLARMELFIFLTSLIQRYQIVPEDENNLPAMEIINGFVQEVKRYRCRFIKID